jgi:hypothetical protein
MYRLKVGDHVRLKGDLSLSQSVRYLRENTKGRILSVHEGKGYTVVFEGEPTPVERLSDHEIELDR